MKTRALMHHTEPGQQDATKSEPYEFARLPVVGELVHLGGEGPMLLVLAVVHTPLDQQHEAEVFVTSTNVVEQIEKARSLLTGGLPASRAPGSPDPVMRCHIGMERGEGSMLSEPTLRLPTWTEGTWATLADGQLWCFPRVEFKMGPRVVKDGRPDLTPQPLPPGYRELMYLAILESEGGTREDKTRRLIATDQVFQAAVKLLTTQYRLSGDEFRALMPFHPLNTDRQVSDEESLRVGHAVLAVVMETARRLYGAMKGATSHGLTPEEGPGGQLPGVN
jgi:hypothetical protein